MMNSFQSQQRGGNNKTHRSKYQPPQLYSIIRGTVTRIEPYGCFVRLDNNDIDLPSSFSNPSSITPPPVTVMGLVHVSQLHPSRITNVNDVVNINDGVFVKVIDIFVEKTINTNQYNNHNVEAGTRTSDSRNNNANCKVRHKIKLSMKYVNQDTGLDLDISNNQLANDMLLSQESSSRGGSGRNNNGNGVNNSHLLERALASNIGISIAIDPGNLILKGKSRTGGVGGGGNLVNGYALVGEEEDEEPSSELISMSTNNNISAAATASSTPSLRPIGRGRGTTLPAWMTKRDEDEDRLKHKADLPDDDNNGVDDDRSSRRRHEKRRSRTKSKSSRRRRHNDNDDDDYDSDRSRRRHEKKKQKRRHRRRRSSSSSSESDHMSRHRRRRLSLSSEGSGNRRKRGVKMI
jgi:predicted RNA-binding protein with RPS1 domain